jgi:hypothetical protein
MGSPVRCALVACSLLSLRSSLGCADVAGLDDFTAEATSSGSQGGVGQGGQAEGGAAQGGDAATTSTSTAAVGGAGGSTSSTTTGVGGGSTCEPLELAISEFRSAGTNGGGDDFIELFNPTSMPVDLEPYRLYGQAPGSSSPPILRFSGAGKGMLASGAHYLIAGASFDDGGSADLCLSVGNSLGDDIVLFLERNGTTVDRLCVCAMATCTDSVFSDCDYILENPTVPFPDTDTSLERDPVDGCWSTDATGESWQYADPPSPATNSTTCVEGI